MKSLQCKLIGLCVLLVVLSACENKAMRSEHFSITEAEWKSIAANPGLTASGIKSSMQQAEWARRAYPAWQDDIAAELKVLELRLWQRKLDQKIQENASKPAAQKQAYNAAISGYTVEEVKLAQIHVPYRLSIPGDKDRAEARMRRAQVLLNNGMDFSAVVTRVAAEKEAALPWLETEKLPAGIQDALLSMEPGAYSAILQDAGAFRIIQLLEKRENQKSLEQVRTFVQADIVRSQKARILAESRNWVHAEPIVSALDGGAQ